VFFERHIIDCCLHIPLMSPLWLVYLACLLVSLPFMYKHTWWCICIYDDVYIYIMYIYMSIMIHIYIYIHTWIHLKKYIYIMYIYINLPNLPHVVDLLSTQPSPSPHLPLHIGKFPVEGMEDLRSPARAASWASPVMVTIAVYTRRWLPSGKLM